MPIEKWSDTVVVAHLSDDPQFSDEMISIEDSIERGVKDVVLDLAALHYLNSSSLARLLRLRKKMAGDQQRLVLCGISDQVWSVFLSTALDKVFAFSDNVPTALATLQLA